MKALIPKQNLPCESGGLLIYAHSFRYQNPKWLPAAILHIRPKPCSQICCSAANKKWIHNAKFKLAASSHTGIWILIHFCLPQYYITWQYCFSQNHREVWKYPFSVQVGGIEPQMLTLLVMQTSEDDQANFK